MADLVFARPKMPWKTGVVYSKTWQAPLVHGVNQVWADRCRGYWDRVEQRFGVVFSDHRNAYDELTGTITTFATVLLVIPGRRYDVPAGETVLH